MHVPRHDAAGQTLHCWNGVRMKIFGGMSVAILALATAQVMGQTAARITLHVDLTDAPRKLIHATETMTVAAGPLTLVYPKWIPGEHAPSGPIDNQAGLVFTCGGADGTRLDWRRDRLDMFAFHMTV